MVTGTGSAQTYVVNPVPKPNRPPAMFKKRLHYLSKKVKELALESGNFGPPPEVGTQAASVLQQASHSSL
jgi:hypothetical protein